MGTATLWRHWFAATTCGEVLGFGVPAVVGAFVVDLPMPEEAVALVAAGAVEGALLGFAQGLVLRRILPGMTVHRWSLATAAGAAMAWAVAMLGVTVLQKDPSPAGVVVLACVVGTLLLASIGVAQWTLLRKYVPASGRWILTTAAAWALGLGIFTAVTTPLWHEGQSPTLIAAIGALGGLAMAATVAAVTGWALVSLTRGAGRRFADGLAE